MATTAIAPANGDSLQSRPVPGCPSPNLFMSSVAQCTPEPSLGLLVMLLSRHHPLRGFEAVCMLGHLSGGTVEMGYVEHGALPIALGYRQDTCGHGARTLSQIQRDSWGAMRGGPFSVWVIIFRLGNVPLALRPRQRPHPPTWIATTRQECTRWAARSGMAQGSRGTGSSNRCNSASPSHTDVPG
ncbi:LLM class flavin-dependent oxidoreductase [Paraburkholderia youngii]